MRRKAVLLTNRPNNEEMEELVFALGADLAATLLQRRLQPDPQLFLGRGKTEEARDLVRELRADLVVVNGHLKPNQIFNLQRFFDDSGRGANATTSGEPVEVYDRTRLILEIFRERAQSPEARLQVELAQLHYEMPLVKEAIHAQRRGERQAAHFGGGEYEVNQYYDMMKKRMARIRRELEKMRRERGLRRKHRRRGGFHLVSLAGYTNAGKSSLLRAMSEREALVENRYFSTLSTKTARARSDRREILVTDTVGFIEDLPPWMVEAFHSTLEEIALADVILLVLDASDPVEEMSRRLRSSLRILWEFDGQPPGGADGADDDGRGGRSGRAGGAWGGSAVRGGAGVAPLDLAWTGEGAIPPSRTHELAETEGAAAPRRVGRVLVPLRRGLAPILVALNKVDRVPPEELEAKRRALTEEGLLDPASTVAVSATTGEGLPDLYEKLYGLIPDYDEYEVALPPSPEAEALIAWIHANADVLDLTRGNEVHLHFEAKRSLRPTLTQRLEAVGATPLREALREADALAPLGGSDAEQELEDVPEVQGIAEVQDASEVQDAPGVQDAAEAPAPDPEEGEGHAAEDGLPGHPVKDH